MISLPDIQRFAARIADEFHPEKIILFGSYAYGAPGEDSDVDLLVVMPFEGRPWHKAAEIMSRIRPAFPVDLMVRTPEKVAERCAMHDWFMLDIVEKGKVLHETHHRRMDSKGRSGFRRDGAGVAGEKKPVV